MNKRILHKKHMSSINSRNNSGQPDGLTNLVSLDAGRPARVKGFQDAQRFSHRLEALGIAPGTIVTKRSAAFMKGPVILERDNMQLAVGYEVAEKIIVETLDNKP